MTKLAPWKTLAARPLIDRAPWLRVWEEDVLLPNGLGIAGYLRTRGRDYAMTFALTGDGTVPLVRQYKHGLGDASYDLPAGYLDSPEEDPLTGAQRELREETGLVAPNWRTLGHLPIDTNRGQDRAHLFLAREASLAGGQHLDPEEALEVSYWRPVVLRQMVYSGEINSLATVAAIMLALDALRAEGPPAARPR
jgi:8-oxo-dGTP pyrophosphatase MutT (NUDIX family)